MVSALIPCGYRAGSIGYQYFSYNSYIIITPFFCLDETWAFLFMGRSFFDAMWLSVIPLLPPPFFGLGQKGQTPP